MKTSSTRALVIAALGIVINIVLGLLAGMIKIPLLHLDTIGTILVAVVLGPWYGAATGGLTNFVLGVLKDPRDIPFAIVNIAVGIVVGLIARKKGWGLPVSILTGLLLAVICPLIGTPIAIYVYGGLTGDFNDVFFTAMQRAGADIFSSAFLPRIGSNLLDKVLSCALVCWMLRYLPKDLALRHAAHDR